MTQPAEEPGTPLEPSGNCRPREMVTHDRIRLTGLLMKSPATRGFSIDRSTDERAPRRGVLNSGDREDEARNERRRNGALPEAGALASLAGRLEVRTGKTGDVKDMTEHVRCHHRALRSHRFLRGWRSDQRPAFVSIVATFPVNRASISSCQT